MFDLILNVFTILSVKCRDFLKYFSMINTWTTTTKQVPVSNVNK